MNTMKIKTKKELINILADRIFPVLDDIEKDVNSEWKVIGKSDRQKKNWRTDELIFDDEGNPVYEDEYGYVPKDPDCYDDNDKAKLAAIENIKNTLEKLI